MTLLLYQGTSWDFFEQLEGDKYRGGCRNGSFGPALRDLRWVMEGVLLNVYTG